MKEDRFTAEATAEAMEASEAATRGTVLAATEASEVIRGTVSAEATATRGTVLAAMAEATAATRSIIIIGTANISDHKRRALLSSRSALLMFLQLCYD